MAAILKKKQWRLFDKIQNRHWIWNVMFTLAINFHWNETMLKFFLNKIYACDVSKSTTAKFLSMAFHFENISNCQLGRRFLNRYGLKNLDINFHQNRTNLNFRPCGRPFWRWRSRLTQFFSREFVWTIKLDIYIKFRQIMNSSFPDIILKKNAATVIKVWSSASTKRAVVNSSEVSS